MPASRLQSVFAISYSNRSIKILSFIPIQGEEMPAVEDKSLTG